MCDCDSGRRGCTLAAIQSYTYSADRCWSSVSAGMTNQGEPAFKSCNEVVGSCPVGLCPTHHGEICLGPDEGDWESRRG